MQTLRIRGPRSGRPAVQTSLFGQARNPEREVTCPRPRKPAEKPGLPSRVLRETAARCTSGKPGSLVGYLRRSRPSRFHGRPRGRTPPPGPTARLSSPPVPAPALPGALGGGGAEGQRLASGRDRGLSRRRRRPGPGPRSVPSPGDAGVAGAGRGLAWERR